MGISQFQGLGCSDNEELAYSLFHVPVRLHAEGEVGHVASEVAPAAAK